MRSPNVWMSGRLSLEPGPAGGPEGGNLARRWRKMQLNCHQFVTNQHPPVLLSGQYLILLLGIRGDERRGIALDSKSNGPQGP